MACISPRIFGTWTAALITGTLRRDSSRVCALQFNQGSTRWRSTRYVLRWRCCKRRGSPSALTLRKALVLVSSSALSVISRHDVNHGAVGGGVAAGAKPARVPENCLWPHGAGGSGRSRNHRPVDHQKFDYSIIRFVLLISTEAEDFWLGNNPHATGHTMIDAEHTVFMTLSTEERNDLYVAAKRDGPGRLVFTAVARFC